MTKIAVLGLGAMGSRLAINYRRAGHDITVWNRTHDAATRLADQHDMAVADTPRRAASDADVIVAMVRDNNAANSVWLDDEHGALRGAKRGSIAIESSTLTPDTVHRLGTAAASAGVRFVEAPVVGSRPQAEAGALFYLLAGEPADVDDARAIIDINAANSARVGRIGNAATLKLAINGLFAAQVAAYAEIVGFIERSDLDSAEALATLRALPITAPSLQRILGLIEERNYQPNFPVHLVAKDLDYLLDTAGAWDSETPVMATVDAVFSRGADGAERDLDIAGIAQHYQSFRRRLRASATDAEGRRRSTWRRRPCTHALIRRQKVTLSSPGRTSRGCALLRRSREHGWVTHRRERFTERVDDHESLVDDRFDAGPSNNSPTTDTWQPH